MMIEKKHLYRFGSVPLALFFPKISLAEVPSPLRTLTVQGELTTYIEALTRLALIMNSETYQGIFGVFVIFSLIVGSVKVVGAGLVKPADNTGYWISLLITLIMGAMIYTVAISETTDMLIIDETTSEFYTVPEVPDGIAFTAGMVNKISQGFIHLIETAGSPKPDGIIVNPSGILFNSIKNLYGKGVDIGIDSPDGPNMKVLIHNYIKDCFLYELDRPRTTLRLDDLYANMDYRILLQEAAFDTIDTLDHENTALSCNEAWTRINTYFLTLNNAHPLVVKHYEKQCRKSGWLSISSVPLIGGFFPATDACRRGSETVIDYIANGTFGGALASSRIVQQGIVNKALADNIKAEGSGGVLANANYAQGQKDLGIGLVAHDWLPVIRSAVYSVYLGIMPFLFLFAVTSLYKQVLSFMLGFFIFYATWDVCDAIVHELALTKAYAVMAELQKDQLGLRSFYLYEGRAMKAYAVFGQYKVASLGLAAVFSTALTRVGTSVSRAIAGGGVGLNAVGRTGAEQIDRTRGAHSGSHYLKHADEGGGVAALMEKGWVSNKENSQYTREEAYREKQKIIDALGGDRKSPRVAAENVSEQGLFKHQKDGANVKTFDETAKETHSGDRNAAFEHLTGIKNAEDLGKATSQDAKTALAGAKKRGMEQQETNKILGKTPTEQAEAMAEGIELKRQVEALRNRAIDEYTHNGGNLFKETQAWFKAISATSAGRNALKESLKSTFVADETQAAVLNKEIGYNVFQAGDTVSASFGMNEKGEVSPSFVKAQEGTDVARGNRKTISDTLNYEDALNAARTGGLRTYVEDALKQEGGWERLSTALATDINAFMGEKGIDSSSRSWSVGLGGNFIVKAQGKMGGESTKHSSYDLIRNDILNTKEEVMSKMGSGQSNDHFINNLTRSIEDKVNFYDERAAYQGVSESFGINDPISKKLVK